MELNFGENIKRLRRSRDLTQEALADALGISAQSVSKWECAYGYPDITQLPAIANFFGVTIDELLSNDEEGREKAKQEFENHLGDFEEANEAKINYILDYCRRYPEEPGYAYMLANNLAAHITHICPENREKYYPLLRSTAEKLLDNVTYRGSVVRDMICACPEEELEEWLKSAAYSPQSSRRNRLIYRYEYLGETEKHRVAVGLGNLEAFAIQLNKRYPDRAGPRDKAAYHKAILDIVTSFGKEGEVPDAWLAFASYKQLVYAACFFGTDRYEEGKTEFLSAIQKFRRHQSLTEEYLHAGSPLFEGVRVSRDWKHAMDENGELHALYGTVPLREYGMAKYIHALLLDPRWAWFNSARNEDYYKEAIAWLEGLGEN